MAISEMKGQGWKVIRTQWRKASDILTSTLAAFLFSSHPKKGKGFYRTNALSVTQPTVSKDWKKERKKERNHWHKSVAAWPHPFFIHHWTPEGWGAASFTLAFQCQLALQRQQRLLASIYHWLYAVIKMPSTDRCWCQTYRQEDLRM